MSEFRFVCEKCGWGSSRIGEKHYCKTELAQQQIARTQELNRRLEEMGLGMKDKPASDAHICNPSNSAGICNICGASMFATGYKVIPDKPNVSKVTSGSWGHKVVVDSSQPKPASEIYYQCNWCHSEHMVGVVCVHNPVWKPKPLPIDSKSESHSLHKDSKPASEGHFIVEDVVIDSIVAGELSAQYVEEHFGEYLDTEPRSVRSNLEQCFEAGYMKALTQAPQKQDEPDRIVAMRYALDGIKFQELQAKLAEAEKTLNKELIEREKRIISLKRKIELLNMECPPYDTLKEERDRYKTALLKALPALVWYFEGPYGPSPDEDTLTVVREALSTNDEGKNV